MNKELIQRLLASNHVTSQDLNEFISQYTYNKLNRHITGEELQGISQLIQMGMFNLRYAVIEAAKDLNLNVMSAFDKNGNILKTYVYEDFPEKKIEE